jgi:hypothetical protein
MARSLTIGSRRAFSAVGKRSLTGAKRRRELTGVASSLVDAGPRTPFTAGRERRLLRAENAVYGGPSTLFRC